MGRLGSMRIQVGEILMNKTKRYLVPVLKVYGKEFEKRIGDVWKVAFGIGDIVVINSNIKLEQHLFILLDTKSDEESFINFMRWVKKQPMYEEDYAYDILPTGYLHMLVVRLPKDYYETYRNFRKSLYSKMFSEADLIKFFNDKPDIKKVLIKDQEYKFRFAQQVNEIYNTDLNAHEIDPSVELDLPISEDDEIFNYHLNKTISN